MIKSPQFATRRPNSPTRSSSRSSPTHSLFNQTFGGAKNEGCAPSDGKQKRCHGVTRELDDRVACIRSPKNRCVAAPEPRKCEYNDAAKSPRCRITKSNENDSRCTITSTGRCGVATKSPRKKRAKPKAELTNSRSPSQSPPPQSYQGGYVFY